MNNPPVQNQSILLEDKSSNVKGKNVQPPQSQQFTSALANKQLAQPHAYQWDNSNIPHIPQPSKFSIQTTPPDPTFVPYQHTHHQYNENKDDQYYGGHFDHQMDWKQHTCNLTEEENIVFSQKQPIQPQQRPHTPNQVQQNRGRPPRFHNTQQQLNNYNYQPYNINTELWQGDPSYIFLSLQVKTLMAGLRRLRNTLKWWEFL